MRGHDAGTVIVIPAAILDDPAASLWDHCRPLLAKAAARALDGVAPTDGGPPVDAG